MQHPINILERYWNFTSFRPLQEDIIEAVLQGEDVFALLPTGGGKSLCFQIPALAKEGICIVVSPLIALMKDQVNALQQKGIKALSITSGIPYHELDTLLDNCIYGNYKFLYLSPERLQQELVQDRIKQMPVNLIAVDEARSEEHTSELQSRPHLVCRLLLEKKKTTKLISQDAQTNINSSTVQS